MAVVDDARGRPWVVGELAFEVDGPGSGPSRSIRVRRPFALVGRSANADIRLDDTGVEARHVFLLLNRRGVFAVDLRTHSGTRFSGTTCDSAWLGPGDSFEVAGHRVELTEVRVDGSSVDPPRPLDVDDPLADAPGRAGLVLEPVDSDGPSWAIGSALAFAGRGEACAVRVEHPSASTIHCAFYRTASASHAIDLVGHSTLVNGRQVAGTSALLDGDLLTLGQVRFMARVEVPSPVDRPSVPTAPIRVDPTSPPPDPSGESAAWLLGRLEAVGTLPRQIAQDRR